MKKLKMLIPRMKRKTIIILKKLANSTELAQLPIICLRSMRKETLPSLGGEK